LTKDVNLCDFEEVKEVLEYGNIVYNSNQNAYSSGNLEVLNGFSATRFVEASFDLMNVDDLSITAGSLTNAFDPTQTIISYWHFTDLLNLSYQIPSIQSQDSFEQEVLGDLEYNYNYTPRLIYFLGTASNYLGVDDFYKIKVDAYGPAYSVIGATFALEPTICSFDTENNNPYPTLRYDTENGLYNTYFNNIYYDLNNSYILTCKMSLRIKDWEALKGNRFVKLYDNLYVLLEIKDYDPLTDSPATLYLRKI
jgi:hypothetical protein